MEQNNHTNYNANEIQVLEGLEAVKRRTIWSKNWWITP